MVINEVVKKVLNQFIDDRCPQIAAALAYTTLLTLIPLAVLIYKVYGAALITPALSLKTHNFIFESLSPSMAKEVQQYLLDGAMQGASLGLFGILTLLISVIIMMYTIDAALNRIWKIHSPGYLVRRIFVYLALLIFGPLAISFSLFASTYIASLPLIASLLGDAFNHHIFSWLPFAVLWMAFTMLYKWVPDCQVKWSHAFIGATFAVCFFEVAKAGFTLYVSYFPSYQILYGALAAIPLLLIWIYLTWVIVLLGAEIAYFMEK